MLPFRRSRMAKTGAATAHGTAVKARDFGRSRGAIESGGREEDLRTARRGAETVDHEERDRGAASSDKDITK